MNRKNLPPAIRCFSVCAGFLILSAFLAHFATAAEKKSWAKISSVSGNVKIRKSPSDPWKKARRNQMVLPGSQIKTEKNSSARVRTKDRHRVRLASRTTIELEETAPKKTTLKVLVGRMRAYVRRLRKQARFRVKSPVAVASVRGTEFDTIVGEDQKTTFEVYKGAIAVRDIEEIGAEVMVFKNQQTTILPGKAPTPPETIPADTRSDLQQMDKSQARQVARLEARREMGLASFKEQLQADVAYEQRKAEYQDGKTVIDAFGVRVRIEEYIVRPEPNRFSFVTLNTRENNFSFSRYDAWALSALPSKINDINYLFQQTGTAGNKPSNYIVRQKWFLSNSGDIYREWSEGGDMVFFPDYSLWNVVYSDWYVEIKGKTADNFRLVSHWQPLGDYQSGADISVVYDDENILIDGAYDVPVGYGYYEGPDAGSIIGDTRPIDNVAYDVRNSNDGIFGSADYQTSEGYERNSYAEFDGTAFADIPTAQLQLAAIFNAKKVSAVHSYIDPANSGSAITSLRVDQYSIDDLGNTLSLTDRRNSGIGIDALNYEWVASSPDFSSPIDLVLTPRIFEKAGLITRLE